MADDPKPDDIPAPPVAPPPAAPPAPAEPELGGRKGLEPTRYGDWEKGGIAVDF